MFPEASQKQVSAHGLYYLLLSIILLLLYLLSSVVEIFLSLVANYRCDSSLKTGSITVTFYESGEVFRDSFSAEHTCVIFSYPVNKKCEQDVIYFLWFFNSWQRFHSSLICRYQMRCQTHQRPFATFENSRRNV